MMILILAITSFVLIGQSTGTWQAVGVMGKLKCGDAIANVTDVKLIHKYQGQCHKVFREIVITLWCSTTIFNVSKTDKTSSFPVKAHLL